MNDARNTIMSAVSDGVMDAESVLSIVINYWMSESDVAEMIEGQIDFEDLREEPEFEPEVDGVQLRYIIHNNSPLAFSASIHTILEDGNDSIDAKYTVTPELYAAINEDVDLESAEETIDYFRELDFLPYADYYLDDYDDVIWTEE